MKKIGKKEAILAVLEQLTNEKIQPDEFTMEEYIEIAAEGGIHLTRDKAYFDLKKLVKNGQATKRKISVNGNLANVYKFTNTK